MYLRNFYKYNEISIYNEICDTIEKASSLNGVVSGVYAKIRNGDYFKCYRKGSDIMLQYQSEKFSIDNVIGLHTDKNDYYLEYSGIQGIQRIKDTVEASNINDYLTMSDEEDFNFLLYVYKLSQDKGRQSIVFGGTLKV